LDGAKDEYIPENRRRIYGYIQDNPGVHLRKIRKELGLAMGDMQYHLSLLEKSGQIKSRRIGMHRHYYPVTVPDERHEVIFAFLGQETARDILVYLIEHPGSTQGDIADFKNFSSPTISWHMSRLVESGIVTSTKEGRTVRYFIKGDVRGITDFLRTHQPNVWNKLASRLADTFIELSSREKEED